MAHHVAHDQGDPRAGQLDHVEPVPSDVGSGTGREVTVGDLHRRESRWPLGSRLVDASAVRRSWV